jgi:hypothetical protein
MAQTPCASAPLDSQRKGNHCQQHELSRQSHGPCEQSAGRRRLRQLSKSSLHHDDDGGLLPRDNALVTITHGGPTRRRCARCHQAPSASYIGYFWGPGFAPWWAVSTKILQGIDRCLSPVTTVKLEREWEQLPEALTR